MARECDLVLVIGSRNSSNSNRLVDVARDMGTDAHLIDNEAQVLDEWLEASAWSASRRAPARPRSSCSGSWLLPRARDERCREFHMMREDVRFMLPKTIRTEMAGQARA